MKRHRHSTTITCRYFIMIVTGFQQNIALKQSRCLTVAQPAAKRSIRADLPFARQSKKKCGIFYEPGMRNGNKPTDGLLWYPRRAVFDTSHQKRPCALRGGTGGATRAGGFSVASLRRDLFLRKIRLNPYFDSNYGYGIMKRIWMAMDRAV